MYSMYIINSNSGSAEVYRFCLEWLRVLSAQDYETALEMLGPDEGEGRWTPERIQRGIETVGLYVDREGQSFRVTDPDLATDEEDLRSCMGPVCREEDFSIDIHHLFPIQVDWLLTSNPEKP